MTARDSSEATAHGECDDCGTEWWGAEPKRCHHCGHPTAAGENWTTSGLDRAVLEARGWDYCSDQTKRHPVPGDVVVRNIERSSGPHVAVADDESGAHLHSTIAVEVRR